ncbi:protein kinase 2B, chloroplastic-like [Gossypium australe]|uniref:Protein kinase 2B, chloroplastic-like n=1 Tax=Gossypium australe TaxID=47621 RepID=A0A5B6X021_9ROSI|nr:protein kinase 2B, chloroplastic-like [Gossypium australe]
MFKQLGLGEPKPNRMNIQLADISIRYHRGIIEDVFVKVDKFIFPVDFVILDMDEDIEVPMISGRPFLAIARIVINVGSGELVLNIGDEKVSCQARDFVRVHKERDDTRYVLGRVDTGLIFTYIFITHGLGDSTRLRAFGSKINEKRAKIRASYKSHIGWTIPHDHVENHVDFANCTPNIRKTRFFGFFEHSETYI